MSIVEICKQFRFEAAHFLPHAPDGHPNRRPHGHSFRVEVWLAGEPERGKGWVRDFGAIDAAMKSVHDTLDHHFLNEVPGLEVPTLENLAVFIYQRLKTDFREIDRVGVFRDSCGEAAVYRGKESDHGD